MRQDNDIMMDEQNNQNSYRVECHDYLEAKEVSMIPIESIIPIHSQYDDNTFYHQDNLNLNYIQNIEFQNAPTNTFQTIHTINSIPIQPNQFNLNCDSNNLFTHSSNACIQSISTEEESLNYYKFKAAYENNNYDDHTQTTNNNCESEQSMNSQSSKKTNKKGAKKQGNMTDKMDSETNKFKKFFSLIEKQIKIIQEKSNKQNQNLSLKQNLDLLQKWDVIKKESEKNVKKMLAKKISKKKGNKITNFETRKILKHEFYGNHDLESIFVDEDISNQSIQKQLFLLFIRSEKMNKNIDYYNHNKEQIKKIIKSNIPYQDEQMIQYLRDQITEFNKIGQSYQEILNILKLDTDNKQLKNTIEDIQQEIQDTLDEKQNRMKQQYQQQQQQHQQQQQQQYQYQQQQQQQQNQQQQQQYQQQQLYESDQYHLQIQKVMIQEIEEQEQILFDFNKFQYDYLNTY